MSNRAFPTDNPFPAAMVGGSSGADYYQPTHLPYQYQANMHRNSARQHRVNASTVAVLQHQQRHAVAQRAAQQQATAGKPGTYCPQGNERLDQVYAKGELYTDVAPPQATQQTMPMAQPIAHRQLSTIDARKDTMQRREMMHSDNSDYMARIRGDATQQNLALRRAAARATNASVSASQAETAKYQNEYKKGNEEAYAHVQALQTSIRGYEDTSKDTMKQLTEMNNREAQRRCFFTSY